MKQRVNLLFLCILTVILLTSCGKSNSSHEHSWKEATCTEPKSCVLCNETEGTALGHDWEKATCIKPKTCKRCHIQEGGVTAHSWVNATCAEPKTCEVCGETEGDALGHNWQNPTLESPWVCTLCGEEKGDCLTLESFNRGKYGKWNEIPQPEQYIGMKGYVAVTDDSFLYSTSDEPYDNDWLSGEWRASKYEKDKQFWNVIGTVLHKTPVTVVGQDLIEGASGTYCYKGYLLVEQSDGEEFYISITDFVAIPYWENDDINQILSVGPCLATYHQTSDYYPINNSHKKADVADGETVLLRGTASGGSGTGNTNTIDALAKSGRCYFNIGDLTVVY